MSASNTEKLVRKCFCKVSCCEWREDKCKTPYSCVLAGPKYLARAARRFVRTENIQKAHDTHMKFVRWCRKHPRSDGKGVKLPKHFGQFKVDGKWI
jgi:hypothetical protein